MSASTDVGTSLEWVIFTEEEHGEPCESQRGCSREAVWQATALPCACSTGRVCVPCREHDDKWLAAFQPFVACNLCNTPVTGIKWEPLKGK